MSLNIGLTGGIGSGKSTVAKIFESLGIPHYSADDRAKWLMSHDADLVEKLTSHFGEQVYLGGELNRPFLAEKIFSNPDERDWVNGVVHPAVARDFERWRASSNAPYVIREAAILFETGGHVLSDSNILVTAPESIRIERVVKRDGVTEDQVKSRMDAQWSEEKKIPLADFIILNDGKNPLIPQVLKIHETILRRANQGH